MTITSFFNGMTNFSDAAVWSQVQRETGKENEMFSSQHEISEAMNVPCSDDYEFSTDVDKTTTSNDQDFCNDLETPIPNNIKIKKKNARSKNLQIKSILKSS